MTGRSVRAARKASLKRTYGELVDFELPAPIPVEPMTPEQEATFALEYQRDAIAENTGPFIPGRY